MIYTRFKYDNFKNFIRNSKIKLENVLYGLDQFMPKPDNFKKVISIEEKIINNLDILTKEDKIVWHKESENRYKGIIAENCTFSDCRIFIKREFLDPEEIIKYKLGYLSEKYYIYFLKGLLAQDKIEYITDSDSSKVDLIFLLIDSIENKLVQSSN